MFCLQKQISAWPRRKLVLEAVLRLFAARIILIFFRFSSIASRLGQLHRPQDANAGITGDSISVSNVAWAIGRAARLLPLPMVCLPRALAAWKMLETRNIECRIHFGVVRRVGDYILHTHAWVDACGIEVTGYPEAFECKEIGFYVGRGSKNK